MQRRSAGLQVSSQGPSCSLPSSAFWPAAPLSQVETKQYSRDCNSWHFAGKATFCTDDRAVSLTRRFQGLSGGTSNSVQVPTSTRPSGSACTTIHPLPLPPSAFCCVAVNASWPGAVLDTYWFCWVVDDTIHMLASTCCGLHIYLLVWLGWGGP